MQDSKNDNERNPESEKVAPSKSQRLYEEFLDSQKASGDADPEECLKKIPELREGLISFFKWIDDYPDAGIKSPGKVKD
ncbi:MAG: hypothetical protein ABIK28_20135, partial [Planctomycetota bacterium]